MHLNEPDPLAVEMRRFAMLSAFGFDSMTGEQYSLSSVGQWRNSNGDQNTREPGEKSDLENLTLGDIDRLNGSTSETNRVTGYTEWRDLA